MFYSTRVLALIVLVLALLGQPAAQAAPAPGVLVVGDSLEVLTIPYLKKYLPGVRLTTNAVGGYNSYQIFDLFQQSYDPSQSVIVFDAGTNDNPSYPQILAGNLNKVAQIIGPNRCMVVPTIHGLVVNGVNNDGKNQTVQSFAASRPGTQTPDWAGAVAAHPELMQPDNLHPIPEGADLRARIIAQGVNACLGIGGAGSAPKRHHRPVKPILASTPHLGLVHNFSAAAARDVGLILADQIGRQDPLLRGALYVSLAN